jgi:hypothetical protein
METREGDYDDACNMLVQEGSVPEMRSLDITHIDKQLSKVSVQLAREP